MDRRMFHLIIHIMLTLPVVCQYATGLITKQDSQHHQLIIIGSGPAGLTAAIYTGRAKLQPLVLAGELSVLGTAPVIENWPGLEHTDGATLINNMRTHAQHVGAHIVDDRALSISLDKTPFTVQTENGLTLTTDAIIIATGTTHKKAHCPGEEEYCGRGVNNCALCDAPLYNQLPVTVIGGGMMALQNVLWLRKYASTITIINDSEALRGPKKMLADVMQTKNLTVLNNCTLRRIIGEQGRVTGINVCDPATNAERTIACNGVFVSLGYEPNVSLVTGKLPINEEGKIISDSLCGTAIPGVFVAGSVASTPHSQAIICAASGSIAAIQAEKFLGHKPRQKSLWNCQKS